MQDQKYICNKCGFDAHDGGYCPMCEEGYMVKVCECQSGKYAYECCEIDLEEVKKAEEMKNELKAQTEKEIAVIAKKEIEKEIKEEELFEEAKEESPKSE